MNAALGATAAAVLLGVTCLLYVLGAASLGANLFLRRRSLLVSGRILAVLGAFTHMAAIGAHCAALKHAPFTTPGESLSLLAWIVVLVYLGTEVLWGLSAAGAFALGLAFVLVLLGAALPAGSLIGKEQEAALLAERAVSLHIVAILTAIGMFALAFCCAVLYLVEHRILKSKHGLAWIKRLPPLATVETAAFTLAALGFPLLTLGILSGLAYQVGRGGLGPTWAVDGKTLLAYAVWAVYGAYLVARQKLDWPPVRTAVILLVGLGLALLLFFVPSAAHRFGR